MVHPRAPPGTANACFPAHAAPAHAPPPPRAGSAGKSTTAWYVRGIFEDWALPGSEPPRVCVVGMAGSLENAVDVARLDRQGDLWQPEEEDPTLDRCACGSLGRMPHDRMPHNVQPHMSSHIMSSHTCPATQACWRWYW